MLAQWFNFGWSNHSVTVGYQHDIEIMTHLPQKTEQEVIGSLCLIGHMTKRKSSWCPVLEMTQ